MAGGDVCLHIVDLRVLYKTSGSETGGDLCGAGEAGDSSGDARAIGDPARNFHGTFAGGAGNTAGSSATRKTARGGTHEGTC